MVQKKLAMSAGAGDLESGAPLELDVSHPALSDGDHKACDPLGNGVSVARLGDGDLVTRASLKHAVSVADNDGEALRVHASLESLGFTPDSTGALGLPDPLRSVGSRAISSTEESALAYSDTMSNAGAALTSAHAQGFYDPLTESGARAGLSNDDEALSHSDSLPSPGFVVQGERALTVRDPLAARGSLPHLVGLVVESWRCYRSWQREEIALTLRIKAWCRRLCPQAETKKEHGGKVANPSADVLYKALEGKGDHPQLERAHYATAPLFHARDVLSQNVKTEEKTLRTLAADLPGARYCRETIGISLFALAAVVGECPGLNGRAFLDFDTYHRVWKRFGLGVVDGKRQHKATGEEGIRQAYSPQRRSVVWILGESALKKGFYRDRYLAIKEREREKWESQGLTILPAKDLPKEHTALTHKSQGDLHNRAKCLMEKELLRDLWREFRTDAVVVSSEVRNP